MKLVHEKGKGTIHVTFEGRVLSQHDLDRYKKFMRKYVSVTSAFVFDCRELLIPSKNITLSFYKFMREEMQPYLSTDTTTYILVKSFFVKNFLKLFFLFYKPKTRIVWKL